MSPLTSDMNYAADATELIGSTPLVRLEAFAPNLLGKVESMNPMSSVKDRIAVSMIEAAERAGELSDETTIIEPTSGNTGIGLAFTTAAKGYDLVLTMPDSKTEERRQLLRALGADLELTPGEDGMEGAIERAEELAAEADDAFIPQQFQNPANPGIHRETTGPEIWEATNGEADVLVTGVGTGGTITGISEYFKEERGKEDFRVVGVEPADSAVLSGEEPGEHGIQGIGAGFVPDVLRRDLIDEVRTVTLENAYATARALAEDSGIMVGISAGANVYKAAEVATHPDHTDDIVVTVLCDTGERYLSSDLFR
ncbi:MAG: cysteine synthase A [Halobacteriales archaeon]